MPTRQPIGMNEEFATKQRRNIFRFVVILTVVVFIAKLGYMQIVKGSTYRLESEAQAIKQVEIEPFRGILYDRNGKIIVLNEPSFSLTITKNDFRKESLPLLASILEVDTTEIINILNSYKEVSKFTPIKIFRDIDFEKIAVIEEYNDLLPGLEIVVDSKRLYKFSGNMAHLLGYIKEVTKEQLIENQYYRKGDLIGQTGLELSYEHLLCGNKGIRFVAINKLGRKVSSFDNGKSDIPANNGFDLHLTIDTRLQIMGERLLKYHRGAIVALDPNNGEILALVSKPDYDPRDFCGRIKPDIYKNLISDPKFPMYNRAIMSANAPGSTWKILVALAALQEGIIDENTTFQCNGSLRLGFRTFKCHGAHGRISLRNAIKASCNVYFMEVALRLGLSKIDKYGKMLGFGDRTYIDLPSETRGRLPTVEWAKKKFGTVDIPAGYLANYGIGQGEIAATPLQMAVYASAIANKGIIYQPHIVRSVHNNITEKVEPISFASREIPISKRYFDLVQNGMYDVVNTGGGTASSARLGSIAVCGKTGTAQDPPRRDHSWFICFAPKKNPKIAISVFVENGGFGAETAAPIARQLLLSYFYPDSLFTPVAPGDTTLQADSIGTFIIDSNNPDFIDH